MRYSQFLLVIILMLLTQNLQKLETKAKVFLIQTKNRTHQHDRKGKRHSHRIRNKWDYQDQDNSDYLSAGDDDGGDDIDGDTIIEYVPDAMYESKDDIFPESETGQPSDTQATTTIITRATTTTVAPPVNIISAKTTTTTASPTDITIIATTTTTTTPTDITITTPPPPTTTTTSGTGQASETQV